MSAERAVGGNSRDIRDRDRPIAVIADQIRYSVEECQKVAKIRRADGFLSRQSADRVVMFSDDVAIQSPVVLTLSNTEGDRGGHWDAQPSLWNVDASKVAHCSASSTLAIQ